MCVCACVRACVYVSVFVSVLCISCVLYVCVFVTKGTICTAHIKQLLSVISKQILLTFLLNTLYTKAYMRMYVSVFGCADIQPTQGVWVNRVGDSVTCGCNNSNLRWKLRCQNDSWAGEKYNCSTTGDRLSSSRGLLYMTIVADMMKVFAVDKFYVNLCWKIRRRIYYKLCVF